MRRSTNGEGGAKGVGIARRRVVAGDMNSGWREIGEQRVAALHEGRDARHAGATKWIENRFAGTRVKAAMKGRIASGGTFVW